MSKHPATKTQLIASRRTALDSFAGDAHIPVSGLPVRFWSPLPLLI